MTIENSDNAALGNGIGMDLRSFRGGRKCAKCEVPKPRLSTFLSENECIDLARTMKKIKAQRAMFEFIVQQKYPRGYSKAQLTKIFHETKGIFGPSYGSGMLDFQK